VPADIADHRHDIALRRAVNWTRQGPLTDHWRRHLCYFDPISNPDIRPDGCKTVAEWTSEQTKDHDGG
jgi:hypothetical protein